MKFSMKALCLASALAAAMALTGCECKHKNWDDATCTKPKTCAKCGETEGEALGHKWSDATCQKPKTCSVCKKTEGEVGEHDWADASCKAPQTCKVCNQTQGEKTNDHKWVDARCTAPKHCSVCGEEVGEKLAHEWIDATCTEPKKCKNCSEKEGSSLGHDYVKGVCSRCGEKDPNYVSPSEIKTTAELKSYLNKNFSRIETPFGTIPVKFDISQPERRDEREIYPYDFYIQANADFFIHNPKIDIGKSYALLPYDLDNLNVTDEQIAETNKAMMDFQKKIADFAIEAFPDKKITGGFYSFSSSGWYEAGGDWHYASADSDSYFTWCNFRAKSFLDLATAGRYDDTYVAQFRWDPTLDDRWYGYSD